MIILYVASSNDVIIPHDDRLPVPSFPQAYITFIELLADYASRHGGRLKVAPPYGAWFRHHQRVMRMESEPTNDR